MIRTPIENNKKKNKTRIKCKIRDLIRKIFQSLLQNYRSNRSRRFFFFCKNLTEICSVVRNENLILPFRFDHLGLVQVLRSISLPLSLLALLIIDWLEELLLTNNRFDDCILMLLLSPLLLLFLFSSPSPTPSSSILFWWNFSRKRNERLV